MKLTKSQRLFIKVGLALAEEKQERLSYKLDLIGEPYFTREELSKSIATTKSKRKKLLREAIEAAILEQEFIYGEGLADAFKSHLE